MNWKYFPRYWPFMRGIPRSPVNSPHKGQWRGALVFSLMYAWINDWVNNREAGDLRRYRSHYVVTVMASDNANTDRGILIQKTKLGHSVTMLIEIRFMMTSSNVYISRITGPLCGEFSGHRWTAPPPPHTHTHTHTHPHKGQWRGVLMFSMIFMNKRLSKQSWDWWLETLSRPLWRHCNVCTLFLALFSQCMAEKYSATESLGKQAITVGGYPQCK